MATTYPGVVTLVPGQTVVNVTFLGGSALPQGGNANVMRSVTGTTNLTATLDWKTLSPMSGTFYLSSAVPNDGTVYKLFFVFYTTA